LTNPRYLCSILNGMFILQDSPIDITKARGSHSNHKNGALVSFEGMVRGDLFKDSRVASLLYIAEAEACIAEGEKIIDEAKAQFPITEAVCIQRIGNVKVEESAIWIGVWAGHRDEAYKASRYIIEEIKKRLKIWKKELHSDGTSKWIHGAETANI
jgi:molybdopterin synthase catalytic subunit